MGGFYDEPVLLIKFASGGVSLAEKLRPPSSGNEGKLWVVMINLTNTTLANLGQYVPNYKEQRYDIAGFEWFQGEGDAFNAIRRGEYQFNLIDFIKDVRDYLDSPYLPFIIGEMVKAVIILSRKRLK